MHGDIWLVDLDGVVWLSEEPIEGSAAAIARLRDAGVRVTFFTNNSYPLRRELLERLARAGVETKLEDLLTSPLAAATLCKSGERALVVGGAGVIEALEEVGVVATPARAAGAPDGFDIVVVGIDPHFDYATLVAASAAVRAGARLIATNDDATFPLPGGVVPGAGAVLAAIEVASGQKALVAGKPHPAAARLVEERLGSVVLVVGDRFATDGRLASELRTPFALVLSGVTNAPADLNPEPRYVTADLQALVELTLGS